VNRLKKHESPRSEGRNNKGKGGTARKRQIDKRNRQLKEKLKNG
jgi:glutathione synthase/RimK-type ligase-like ATP-grasp enzyme